MTAFFRRAASFICGAVMALGLAAPAFAGTTADWTVMVYVNGKNNLEDYAMRNFYQMEAVGSNSNLNIVVQLGRLGTYSTKDGAWKGCRRYLVEQHADTDVINSPVVSSTSVCDMGDYRDAIAFSTWAVANYPANHYMFILWNHGSGWYKTRAQSTISRGISYDDETNNHITTPQMGLIMQALGHTDVYASDACLMQMGEIGYELKNYTDYIVGSEESEPGEGMQYATFLSTMAVGGVSAPNAAQAVVDTYINQYTAADGVTMSYIQTSYLDTFVTKLNTFASAMVAANDHPAALAAANAGYNYSSYNFRDIARFADVMASSSSYAAVRTSAADLSSYVKNTLVRYNRFKGSDYAYSYGISMYMPTVSYNTDYSSLAFYSSSTWPSFVQWLVNDVRVAGTITYNGNPLSGVTVTATGGTSAVTDANGAYSMSLAKGGSYTLVPSLSGYSFTPSSIPLPSLSGESTANSFTAAYGVSYPLLGEAASYPNPFAALKGEKAKLHYTLDAARELRIRIYNTAGQLVWEYNAPAGGAGGMAGVNEVLWDGRDGDGRNVGRGIYLAAIEAGGQRATVKVGVR